MLIQWMSPLCMYMQHVQCVALYSARRFNQEESFVDSNLTLSDLQISVGRGLRTGMRGECLSRCGETCCERFTFSYSWRLHCKVTQLNMINRDAFDCCQEDATAFYTRSRALLCSQICIQGKKTHLRIASITTITVPLGVHKQKMKAKAKIKNADFKNRSESFSRRGSSSKAHLKGLPVSLEQSQT